MDSVNAWKKQQSPWEQGLRVILRCGECDKDLANAYVTPGKVTFAALSLFESRGIKDAGPDGYEFTCTRSRCTAEPITIGKLKLAAMVQTAAGLDGSERKNSLKLSRAIVNAS